MSDWKKFAITWMVSILAGFYSMFVLMEMWNWFAVPLLHVSESSYWLMYGVSMLFGLMTGASDGEQENPVHEQRWKSLFIALDARVSLSTRQRKSGRKFVRKQKVSGQMWA